MITIPTQILKAALLCAGVKDIRNYMNGVHIERAATGEVHVMSTDGGVAFVCPLDAAQVTECTQVGPWRLTIPYDIVKTAIKSKAFTLTLLALTDGRYSLGDDSFALSFAPVDGKFPDIRRIVPRLKSTEIEAHQFNPDLAVRCRDALRLVIASRSQQAHIDHSFGGKGMLVTMPKTTAFCVLAGLRGVDPSPICALPDYGA